ncbi:MAG: D-alanine--D-alanine ligase [Deltaproteobacteria bacterium]|nr:D-alanine--D-alanine ligase [Deltaproteobacteria bacterium]
MRTPLLTILFGGTSGERRVSVASAAHVAALLPEAQCLFWTPDNRLQRCAGEILLKHARPFEEDFVPEGQDLGPIRSAIEQLAQQNPETIVFLALHGGQGEDGTVQRWLEHSRLAYTGSDSTASARAFDKNLAKSLVEAAGGRVAPSRTLPPDDVIAIRAAIEQIVVDHGRAVVKPVADGSSVGLFHARSLQDARTIAEEVASHRVAYLVEAFVSGPELTVGVTQRRNGETQVLCASEVRLDPGRVFDFEGKYLGKGTLEFTPAEQPDEVLRAAEALALLAHKTLGCEGYTRTDIIVGAQGPVYLETNTLPGLTKASFIPQQVTACKMSLEHFVREHVALAQARRVALRALRETSQ